MLIVTIAD